MPAPDLSTRDKAFAHLKAIVLELEQERAGQRRRTADLEFRCRRLEIALTLTYAEMIARSKPELARKAEAVVDARLAQEEGGTHRPERDFVAELEAMAAPERRATSSSRQG